MKTEYTCPAPAKINWFLHITGKREDGYHNLSTLFQFIDLQDELTFKPIDTHEVRLSGDLSGVIAEKNLVYKAAQALIQENNNVLPCGIEIDIQKNIPSGAGLGGGSSDAATTLLMLNKIWQLNYSNAKLRQIGQRLGADVPVFVNGLNAFATGIGEVLNEHKMSERTLLLALPTACHISTPKMFADKTLKRDSEILTPASYQFTKSRNDFQPIVTKLYPQVAKTLQWLLEYAPSRLTGTGACCFALVENTSEAKKVAAMAPEDIYTFVVNTLKTSPVHLKIAEQFS
ncbi:4-(cytidine 5'-diphospho)-2-C-methyl-D-erythritol kinase [Catenovulum sediminis]|uniref:4-diphosphocytidyl-2-C-methyl-D-erythritol kinase n=1 Tax=Catenovulum sediminis TaxID=1740262 RepID=A0ABV1RKR5_9ALTE|nr:4-(cytidine 5'-diphospho)-2-C-methyl-D-erythritol kinase [Catenovulum sediminis]